MRSPARRRSGAIAILVAGLMAPAAGAADPPWTPDERAAAAADDAFHAASLTRKGQAWKEFADADATVAGARGRDAIGALYDTIYGRPGFRLDWHPTYAKAIGDIVITSGPYERHVRSEAGEDKRSTGTYVTVWQRQKDGGWRFVWDGGTPDP